jgi:hypothetical protein
LVFIYTIMPTYKARLTRREQAKYLAVARELAATGIQLQIPDEWQALQILIGGPPESYIHQLGNGLVVYSLWVSMVAERGGIILRDFQIATAWDSDIFPCGSEDGTQYRCADGCDHDGRDVLNHRIENNLRFSQCGDIREGWLLAMGRVPVPKEYGPGKPAPVQVVFLDQFFQEHTATAELLVQRSPKTRKPSVQLGPGLYEREKATASERVTGGDSVVPSASRSSNNVASVSTNNLKSNGVDA